ncbi:MAG: substrate-binding domain-containing protein [Bilophila wadsworthia]
MKRIVLASLLALSCLLPAQAKAADEIVVNGSTTVLPIMQKVSKPTWRPIPTCRSRFPAAVPAGIRPCSTGWPTSPCLPDIKGSERNWPPEGHQSRHAAVAVDALVPVVNPKNPINELSLDQLKDIYTGKITIGRNWAAPTPTSWSCPATRPPAPTKRGKKWS